MMKKTTSIVNLLTEVTNSYETTKIGCITLDQTVPVCHSRRLYMKTIRIYV